MSTMICQAPNCAPAADHYAAEVDPPDNSTLTATEFNELTLDTASGYFLVTLPSPVHVSGLVRTNDLIVPGTVVFSRPSRISGRPDVFYQATVDASTGGYQISVPPNAVGESYTVTVHPTDIAKFPPVTQTVQLTKDRTLDLVFASGSRLFTLRGDITDVLYAPLSNVRVVLRDASTLLDLSTTVVTDLTGHFELSISQDSGFDGPVVLTAEQGTAATGLITMSVPLTSPALEAQLASAAMQLQFPAIPAATHRSFVVVGSSTSGADKLVAGAQVRLTATLVGSVLSGGVQVSHEIELQTNSDGKFEADLYSDETGTRKYKIAISPPSDSEFQTTSTEVVVASAPGLGASVRLPIRPLVTGRVLDPMGVPLKGVVVQPALSTLAASAATSLATSSRAASASTDVDGRFALRIDAGAYDLALVPPATSQLPRTWLTGQTIVANVDLGDLNAPSSVIFDAVVLGPDSKPTQAAVHVFVVPAHNTACASTDRACLAPPRLQADGSTDQNGRAPLLLPSTPIR